jgi:hypothetical protein
VTVGYYCHHVAINIATHECIVKLFHFFVVFLGQDSTLKR